MSTFAEYLPTMTARERDIVVSFHQAMEKWHDDDNPKEDWPFAALQAAAAAATSEESALVSYQAQAFAPNSKQWWDFGGPNPSLEATVSLLAGFTGWKTRVVMCISSFSVVKELEARC